MNNEVDGYDHGPTKAERTRVIEHLEHSYAQDLLDMDVFERRMERAVNTASKRELLNLVEDLPAVTEAVAPDTSLDAIHLNREAVRDNDLAFAIMSGVTKKGPWSPPRSMRVVAVMGGVDLDYTEARIPPGVSTIDIFACMGGVDIFVPEGLNVELSGIPIMGGIDNYAADHGRPGAPTLRINAIAFMGGVDVKIRKRKKIK